MSAPANTKTPRAACYHAIHNLFTGAMARYLIENRALLDDFDRVKAANKELVKLMEEVLAKLDEYAIEALPKAPE